MVPSLWPLESHSPWWVARESPARPDGRQRLEIPCGAHSYAARACGSLICSPGKGRHVNGERVRWAWLGDGDTLRIRLVHVHRAVRNVAPDRLAARTFRSKPGQVRRDNPGTELAVRSRTPGK